MLEVSLETNLFIIHKDQVFIADVVVTNLMWEMVASNVISRPIGATMKLNAIVNIHKYNGFHEGHHFISMAMEVHNAPGCDMDNFIRECVHLFHDK
jgi:hypothetical protein